MGLRLRLIQVDEGEVTLIAPGPGPPSCRPSRWGLTACHLGWYLRTPAQLGTNGAPTEAPPPEALCLGVLVAPARPWELGAIWAHPSVNAGLVPALLVPPRCPWHTLQVVLTTGPSNCDDPPSRLVHRASGFWAAQEALDRGPAASKFVRPSGAMQGEGPASPTWALGLNFFLSLCLPLPCCFILHRGPARSTIWWSHRLASSQVVGGFAEFANLLLHPAR